MTHLNPSWDVPTPHQVPELRLKMVQYLDSSRALDRAHEDLTEGFFTFAPHVNGIPQPHAEVRQTRAHLASAPLYWVSSHAVQMASQLARDPSPARVDVRSAPPTLSGFAFLEEPLLSYDYDLNREVADDPTRSFVEGATMNTPITAISWHPLPARPVGLEVYADSGYLVHGPSINAPDSAGAVRRMADPSPTTHTMVRFYTPAERTLGEEDPDQVVAYVHLPPGPPHPVTLAQLLAQEHHTGPLEQDNELVFINGSFLPPATPEFGISGWMRPVQRLWQTMGRSGASVTERENLDRPRAGRRRDSRAGVDSSPVQIIRLKGASARRTSAERAASGSSRTYSVQWEVPAFLRDTCLNTHRHADGECEHEERIVSSHVRGPSDKPLRLSNRVRMVE